MGKIPKAYIIGGAFIIPAFISAITYWNTNPEACLWAGFSAIIGAECAASMRLVDKLLEDLKESTAVIAFQASRIRELIGGHNHD